MSPKQLVIQKLWDALSDILEDPLAQIDARQRKAGLKAIALAQLHCPEEG